MSEVKTPPIEATLVESIVDEAGPAGAIKFWDGEGFSPRGFHFRCPCGCGDVGSVIVAGPRAWQFWNGSKEKPTVRESVLLYTNGQPHWHGYLTDGVWLSC